MIWSRWLLKYGSEPTSSPPAPNEGNVANAVSSLPFAACMQDVDLLIDRVRSFVNVFQLFIDIGTLRIDEHCC